MNRRSLKPHDPVNPQPLRPFAAPDVTPLLGVLLVIVVSFMAALPSPRRLNVHLPIDVELLPSYAQTLGCDDEPVIEYGPDHRLVLNRQDVTHDEMKGRIRSWLSSTRCKNVYVIAEPNVPYGEVAGLVDAARAAGAANVVMITEGIRRRARGELPAPGERR